MGGVKAGPLPKPLEITADKAASGVVAKADEDAVYFCVDKVGVVRLDNNGFKKLSKPRSWYCKAVFTNPLDGRGYLLGWSLDKLTSSGQQAVASKSLIGGKLHDFAAFGPGGSKLVGGFQGIWFNDGKRWTSFDKAAIGYSDGIPKHAYIDQNKHIWFATGYGFFHYDGTSWRTVFDTASSKDKIFISKFFVLADGRVLFLTGGKLAVYDGTGVSVHRTGGYASPQNGFIGADGLVYMVTFDTVTGYDLSDFSAQKAFALKESSIKATSIKRSSMDQSGRIWLNTDAGVVILDKDLNPTLWPTSSMAPIAGKISNIIGVGKGPATLPSPGKVATGTIRGQLLKDDVPVVNTAVELCESPSMMFKKTPCTDKPFMRTVKTDAQGNFVFSNVPLSSYGVAAKVGGKWSRTMFSNCAGMKEGETCSLGKLSIRSKKK